MKFTSLDDLVEYLKHENIKISDLEFSTPNHTEKSDTKGSEKNKDKKEDTVKESIESIRGARIKSFYGDPEIPLVESNENILYVNEFTSIPNSCHMGKINILDREVYAGICSESDDSKIDLVVEYEDASGEAKIIRETFKLKTTPHNTSEKILLNIQE